MDAAGSIVELGVMTEPSARRRSLQMSRDIEPNERIRFIEEAFGRLAANSLDEPRVSALAFRYKTIAFSGALAFCRTLPAPKTNCPCERAKPGDGSPCVLPAMSFRCRCYQ